MLLLVKAFMYILGDNSLQYNELSLHDRSVYAILATEMIIVFYRSSGAYPLVFQVS